jgi:hypothetical protein
MAKVVVVVVVVVVVSWYQPESVGPVCLVAWTSSHESRRCLFIVSSP